MPRNPPMRLTSDTSFGSDPIAPVAGPCFSARPRSRTNAAMMAQGNEGVTDLPICVLTRMRNAFVETAGPDIERLRVSRRNGDRQETCDIIHSFKGALFMLGETDIANRCLEMEMRLLNLGVAELCGGLNALEVALWAVIARYRATPVQ